MKRMNLFWKWQISGSFVSFKTKSKISNIRSTKIFQKGLRRCWIIEKRLRKFQLRKLKLKKNRSHFRTKAIINVYIYVFCIIKELLHIDGKDKGVVSLCLLHGSEFFILDRLSPIHKSPIYPVN